MKSIYLTLLLSLIVSLSALAQNSATTFSLDDCIKYAMDNTINIKNAKVDELIAESVVKETIGLGLPQVSGSVGVTTNPKLPRFYSKYDEDVEGPFTDGLAGIPGIKSGDLIGLPNFFQQPNSGNAGLTINQLIFNTTYLVGLKASSTYKELSQKATEQTKIEVIEFVSKAYYAVLISNEQITLFDNNIARVDSLLRTTKALNQNGFAEGIDVDRTQVTLNNLKSERLNFINNQALALSLLKFQMNYPMDQPLVVTGSIGDLKVNENLFNEYQDGWDYKNLIGYKMLETQRKLQELDIKAKQSVLLPNLTGFANLGYSTMSPSFGGIFKTESSVEKTDFYGPDSWYPNSSLGLSLNIPIFSGMQLFQRTQQSKLALQKIENNFISFKEGVDLSIRQNTITFQNALETVKSQQENMTLADKVARITKIKYEQGVGSNIEVTDAENSLRQAQVNYYRALYDAILSKIDLDRAYGKIDPSTYTTTK